MTASCNGASPGRAPSYAPLSPSQRWNSLCSAYGSYLSPSPGEGGSQVAVSSLPGAATLEQVASFGYDPTGTYSLTAISCSRSDAVRGGSQSCTGLCGSIYSVLWETSPPVPVTTLRDSAKARIRVPSPSVGSSPPWNDPNRYGIVHVPTWFWVTDPWVPVADQETSGFVTVEVAATPIDITWNAGDGDSSVCDHAGLAWRSGLSEDEPLACHHTYTRSSARESDTAYSVTVEVLWEYEWWINGAPQGVFDTYTASEGFNYPVAEIQIVETG